MKNVMVSWIGKADLGACQNSATAESKEIGSIAQVVSAMKFDQILLLSSLPEEECRLYYQWLTQFTGLVPVTIQYAERMDDPTDYDAIYSVANSAIKNLKKSYEDNEIGLWFAVSSGTPAMQAIWIILSQTAHPAKLIQASVQKGVKVIDFPFNISAEYRAEAAKEMIRSFAGESLLCPEFDRILHRCLLMKQCIRRAMICSKTDLPVVICGESGTGKELFAGAIHASSRRSKASFCAVNCAALSEQLIESELFGHEKGAFTGAVARKIGRFESAHKGTLFLDEIGELPLQLQAKLLRVLQEGRFERVGGSATISCDVRIIAATNRVLWDEVAAGRFREDLYYRLAVAIIQVPPLRERHGDVRILIDSRMESLNGQFFPDDKRKYKSINAGGLNRLLQHKWPGNVRELHNVIARAMLWAGSVINEEDISYALSFGSTKAMDKVSAFGRNIGPGFRLEDVLDEVARHYIDRAIAESDGNKSKAAKLLSFGSYQTLTNWMRRLGGYNC